MPQKVNILKFQSNGTWTGYMDMNAGDPGNPWPVNQNGTYTEFSLAGYAQNTTQYVASNINGGVLSMYKAGHAALILDDSISPGSNGAWLTGVTVINGGPGTTDASGVNNGQLIDMTSTQYRYGDLTIKAGLGNDILMGNAGKQFIYGNGGNDFIWGGSGTDSLYGGAGNDTVTAGGNGNDQLFGGAGNDSLIAGNGNESLYGGSGNDTIVAGLGNQVMDGGSGANWLDLSKLNGPAHVDIGDHELTVTVNGVTFTDVIKSFSTIVGTSQGSFFDGGQAHPETLVGGAGNDTFHSESGGDQLTGGGGSNTYEWYKKFVLSSGKTDTITDFHVGSDHLDLTDFLKGQVDPANAGHNLKAPSYAQVVHLVADAAGTGTDVQVLTNGTFHTVVDLVGVTQAATADATHYSTLSDLLLH